MIDVLLDTLLDAAKLIPFLYLTYLLLEFIEHRAKEQTEALMKKAGKWGPLLGGALGAALAIAKLAKVEVEIIANDQEVGNIRLIEINYRANTTPDVVIKSLWLYKKQIVLVVASDLGEKFSFALPVDLGEFGVKI